MRSSTAVGMELSTAMRTMVSTPVDAALDDPVQSAGAALEMKAQARARADGGRCGWRARAPHAGRPR